MAAIRNFLSYMPSHNGELSPVAPVPEGSGENQEQILAVLPEKRTQVYNMKKIVETDRRSPAAFSSSSPVSASRRRSRRLRGSTAKPSASSPTTRMSAAAHGISAEGLPQDHRSHGVVRQLQHSDRAIHGHAGLRCRPRRRAARRAGPHHEFHECNQPDDGAANHGDLPQGLPARHVAMGGGVQNDAMVAWPTAEGEFYGSGVCSQHREKPLAAARRAFEETPWPKSEGPRRSGTWRASIRPMT